MRHSHAASWRAGQWWVMHGLPPLSFVELSWCTPDSIGQWIHFHFKDSFSQFIWSELKLEQCPKLLANLPLTQLPATHTQWLSKLKTKWTPAALEQFLYGTGRPHNTLIWTYVLHGGCWDLWFWNWSANCGYSLPEVVMIEQNLCTLGAQKSKSQVWIAVIYHFLPLGPLLLGIL